MIYTDSLSEDECEKLTENGETLYSCDGVLYRSTFYEDQKVYEIVSDAPGETGTGSGGAETDVVGMGVTDPVTSGETVRDLQNRLVEAGYDVGGADGVFGTGTETALMWYQYDNKLEPSGVVDLPTAQALRLVPPPTAADPAGEAPADAAEDEPVDPEAPPGDTPVDPEAKAPDAPTE